MTDSKEDGFIIGELMALELTDLITRWGERIQSLADEGADLATLGPVLHQVLVTAADGFVDGLPPAVLDGSDAAGMINKVIGEALNARMMELHRAGQPHAEAPAQLADYLERAAAAHRKVVG